MTSAQIKYIVTNILGDNMDTLTVLRNNNKIQVTENIQLYTDINRYRFYFDSKLEVLKIYYVRLYSDDLNDVPEHGNYSVITTNNGTNNYVYEIMSDSDGKAIYDVYCFDAISFFTIAKNNPTDYITIRPNIK